jgi:hypothetical protein
MSPVKRSTPKAAAERLSPVDLDSIACLIISKMPKLEPVVKQNPLGQFLAGYGSLILVIVMAVGGYIFYFGSQGQKVDNFDSTLNSVRSQMVTTDLLNSRFRELNAKQDAISNSLEQLTERVTRLEGKAMSAK